MGRILGYIKYFKRISASHMPLHSKAIAPQGAGRRGGGCGYACLSVFSSLYPAHPMKNKSVLEHADVQKLAAAAAAEAVRNGWAVSIAVVDDGGHLLGQFRLDGAAPMSARMAPAKARSAALGRRETKAFEDMINQGRTAFLSAPDLEGMLEGGVPIVAGGHVIGAVGVSGVKSSEDVQIARAGIAALQLPG